MQGEDGHCKQPSHINQRHFTVKTIQFAHLADLLQHIFNVLDAREGEQLDQQGSDALAGRDLEPVC